MGSLGSSIKSITIEIVNTKSRRWREKQDPAGVRREYEKERSGIRPAAPEPVPEARYPTGCLRVAPQLDLIASNNSTRKEPLSVHDADVEVWMGIIT